MVLVTDKQYYMEPRLKDKLDLMIYRMTKAQKDNLVLIDGDEGDGKTNMEMGIAYYVAHETHRPFGLKNVFFNLDELINFAISTKEQIICWDEGALGGMAQEWWKKNQMKFIRLLMVARKKRHFFIICIPKFFKLNEYFVVDRSICLIHVYLRGGIQYGRFVYFSQKAKEKLWQDWRKTKYRNYKKFYLFHGSFPEVLGKKWFEDIVPDKEYNDKKDIAILSIDKEDETKDVRIVRRNWIRLAVAKLKLGKYNIDLRQLGELLDTKYDNMQSIQTEVNHLLAKEGDAPSIKALKSKIYNTMSVVGNGLLPTTNVVPNKEDEDE